MIFGDEEDLFDLSGYELDRILTRVPYDYEPPPEPAYSKMIKEIYSPLIEQTLQEEQEFRRISDSGTPKRK